MNRTKHFTLWLLKRIATAILYGPRRIHEYLVDKLEDEWVIAVLVYSFACLCLVVGAMTVLMAGDVTKEAGIPILQGLAIACGVYLVIAVIHVQYRIYCAQLENTMNSLKRDYDEPPF